MPPQVAGALRRVVWHGGSALLVDAGLQRCAVELFGPDTWQRAVVATATRLAAKGELKSIEACIQHCALSNRTVYTLRRLAHGPPFLRAITGALGRVRRDVPKTTTVAEVRELRAALHRQRARLSYANSELAPQVRAAKRELHAIDALLVARIPRVLQHSLDTNLASLRQLLRVRGADTATNGAAYVDALTMLMRNYGHHLSPALRARYQARINAAVAAWLRAM